MDVVEKEVHPVGFPVKMGLRQLIDGVPQRGLAALGRNQKKKVSSQFGRIRSLFANDLLFTTKVLRPGLSETGSL